jgi:hypothetical protein
MLKLLLSCALFLCSCGPVESNPCATPNQSRCSENRVELCSPAKQWMTVMDCTEMSPTWFCTGDEAGKHFCTLKEIQ